MYKSNYDYDLAIADYTEAIRIDPDYAEAYFNRSRAYSGKGHGYKKLADADYKLAIKLDPSIIYKNNPLGGVFAALGSIPRTKK